MVYIICFILTPLFTYLADKQFEKGNKINGLLFMFLALLIPSLVAGFRATNVGRDSGAYVTPAINNALSMDFKTYMQSPINFDGYLEAGYRILIYGLAHISSSTNFSMFILQFLTILFVSLFAYKNRNKMNMTFVMIIYMLLWYCMSFTFMRQSLAIAIILYSTTFFEKKQFFKTLLLYLLAISIHIVSVVSIIIYGLMFISQSNLSIKKKKIIYFLYFVLLVISTLCFEQIVYFFTNIISILPDKYYAYTQFYSPKQTYSQLSDLTLRIFFIIAALFYMKFANKEKSKIDSSIILLLLLTDLALFLISYKIVNVSRIGFYYLYLGLFYLIPNVSNAFTDCKKTRFLISILCIIVMLGWWTWKFPIRNWCETFPYHSDIIKFLQ